MALSLSRLAPLLAALAAAGCGPRGGPDPITVGQVVPLSGPDRARGEAAHRGARLALQLAPEGQREVRGRPVVVRHADAPDAEAAGAQAVRLARLNRAAALLAGPGASRAEAVARAAAPLDVPVVLAADAAPWPPGEPAVCLAVDPAARGRVLARFAAEDLKAARAAVLRDGRSGLASAVADGFARAWRSRGAVREWSFATDAERDALAARVAGDGERPDVVLLAATPDDALRLRRALADAKVEAKGLYGGEDAGPAAAAGGGAGEVYLATAYDAGGLTQAGKEFAARYEQEFHEPPDLAAALAYDGVRLLLGAFARAGGAVPARVREELVRAEGFEAVTGPLAFRDRYARRTLFVVRVRGGAADLVRTFPPEAD
jgi:branched-chain amino acid transport system substrate-binding protein